MAELNDDLAALRIEREPESAPSGRWVEWAILLVDPGGAARWRPGQFSDARAARSRCEVATVTERAAGTQAAVLNASGYVTARRRATVSSKITGKVIEVNVDEGMAVKEGQVLARLDDVTARASVALAEAQVDAARGALDENEVRLAEAQVTLTRMSGSAQGRHRHAGGRRRRAGGGRLDRGADPGARASRSASPNARWTSQQTNLDDTVIRAPFSGVAISKDAQPGEMVSPVSAGGGFTRTGICTIVDMHSLEIEVDVNESYINRVKPGQEVTAVLDAYPDWQIPAEVITTVPTADRQKATVLVRIGFKAARPAHPARHGREGHVPARGRRGRRAPAAQPIDARAEERDSRRQRPARRLRRARRHRRAPRGPDGRHRRRPARSPRRPARLAIASWSPRRRRCAARGIAIDRHRRSETREPAHALSRPIRDVHKHFTRGSERIDVLKGVNLDIPQGEFLGADGAVGIRQDDAAQPDGRPRQADRRHRSRSATSRIDQLGGGQLVAVAIAATSASCSSCTTCCRC